MRGKGSINCMQINSRGITPAHAGKSLSIFDTHLTAQDHPRTCGEKDKKCSSSFTLIGSPPHMRGKGTHRRLQERRAGITPAHAGKSCCFFFSCFFCRDHPRTCGEKIFFLAISSQPLGSPPHMRGKARPLFSRPNSIRITPAHAGKR